MTATAAAAARPVPLAAAAARLREHLRRRWTAQPHGSEPRVVTLGDIDALAAPAAAQPHRRDATVHLSATAVLIGPYTGAAGRGCGHCLAIRWQRLRTRSERDALEVGEQMTPVGPWPQLTAYQLDAVWDLHRAIHAGPPLPPPPSWDRHSTPLPRVSQLDLNSLCVRSYPLLAEPRCPSCAVPQPDTPDSPMLAPEPRLKPHPDTYRLRTPGSYPLPEAALVNPVCGALGAGTQLTITSPTTAPVTGSVFIRGYGGLLDVSFSGQASGYDASRSLAYLEGLERYAGTHRRRNVTPVIAAYADLGAAALHPDACGSYPDAVYDSDPILRRFDPQRPIPWVWGRNLHTGQPVLVPRRLCFYSSPAAGDTFLLSSSSGCATGSCLEEAALFGLLELIERDAFLLAWYGNLTLPRIDLDGCPPAVRAMADRAELQGYRLYAFDNRIDLDVPVVTSLAVRHDGGPGLLSFAAAAHVDPQQAVAAALAEALTYIPHQPATVRRRRPELERMADDYSLVRRLPDHSALFGLPRMAVHAESYLHGGETLPAGQLFAGYRAPGTRDLRDDLHHVLDLLRAQGLEAIMVDQTTPEQETLGLSSVCMIVPGLLPIDFGWIRQRAPHLPRLRAAPAAAGLADAELTDADLRLVPHPFP
ncbi:TOMM precursor leader peptide-binding protein [Micromonospora krabiensis]|uniref:Ribosomal protein S12 methylthiotransferase accessory factor n=1 Tax=Micromonospora krabiensis TaxID=307121 RepID=A0A1C3MWX3_9ACTN|nr:TOMM precursor leader peptide-binding protein [Micromonospora krabiensis]SBV24794.1 ribosomal protein S12 methylthiotransferase accessory factor [Micromonospora krabiensis]